MGKVRSPNYPSVPLGSALEAVRPVFKKENRNKMSRLVLAKHMGYTSLNGRALTKIGAVRSYGLLDGSGDELRVSDDAIAALNAPKDSQEGRAALGRLALKPSLFGDIRKQYPETHPSRENLTYWLVTQNFTTEAAEKAAKSYLVTMALAEGKSANYSEDDDEGDDESDAESGAPAASTPAGGGKPAVKDPQGTGKVREQVKLMDGERVLTTGLLSKGASFRLVVTGDVGVKEIERLIAKLELDKEILGEPDPDEPSD